MQDLRAVRMEFNRFMLRYKFATDEMTTRIDILREEFTHIHDYNPIEHVSSRIKSPESIFDKIQRKGGPLSLDAIGTSIQDIAGIRIVCSFVSDVYRVFRLLSSQHDISIVDVKDYIASPKPNGYKSLHLILEVPVFLSDGVQAVLVEVQVRTIAMDFWASLEHKIYYKYGGDVPQQMLDDLSEAAATASRLDATMARLHSDVRKLQEDEAVVEGTAGQPEALSNLVPVSDHLLTRLHSFRKVTEI